MLSPSEQEIITLRILEDDLVLSALDALCRQESQRAISRLIDHGQRANPSPTQIAVDAAEARFWRDLPDTLRRRAQEKPQEAPA